MSKRICKWCNQKIAVRAKFCWNCGGTEDAPPSKSEIEETGPTIDEVVEEIVNDSASDSTSHTEEVEASSNESLSDVDGAYSVEITIAPKKAEFVILSGPAKGRTLSLEQGECLELGSEASLNGGIEDSYLSSKHARIEYTPDGLVIEDLESTNGTYLCLSTGHRLRSGDRIRVGKSIIGMEVME